MKDKIYLTSITFGEGIREVNAVINADGSATYRSSKGKITIPKGRFERDPETAKKEFVKRCTRIIALNNVIINNVRRSLDKVNGKKQRDRQTPEKKEKKCRYVNSVGFLTYSPQSPQLQPIPPVEGS